MAAIGAVPQDVIAGFTILGELGLDGSIAAVAGVLPAAIGALLDRIDLHIEVPAVTASDLILPPPSEGSREVAARVRARAAQCAHQCAGQWADARAGRALADEVRPAA